MRHKMITLCPTSYEIAQKMDNFSAWVRKKLYLEESEIITEDPIFWLYQCPVCSIKEESEKRWSRNCAKCHYQMKFLGAKE